MDAGLLWCLFLVQMPLFVTRFNKKWKQKDSSKRILIPFHQCLHLRPDNGVTADWKATQLPDVVWNETTTFPPLWLFIYRGGTSGLYTRWNKDHGWQIICDVYVSLRLSMKKKDLGKLSSHCSGFQRFLGWTANAISQCYWEMICCLWILLNAKSEWKQEICSWMMTILSPD